jgi:hypothetical protein
MCTLIFYNDVTDNTCRLTNEILWGGWQMCESKRMLQMISYDTILFFQSMTIFKTASFKKIKHLHRQVIL